MGYSVLHVIHLTAAIFFIGTLFVEVAVLAAVRRQLQADQVLDLDSAVGARRRTVLHWVVVAVYGAGLGLAWYHSESLAQPFASSFATLLWLKIFLAVGVFLSFGAVALVLRSGRMTVALYRRIHWLIFAQMLGIVLLAKAMFYLHW